MNRLESRIKKIEDRLSIKGNIAGVILAFPQDDEATLREDFRRAHGSEPGVVVRISFPEPPGHPAEEADENPSSCRTSVG